VLSFCSVMKLAQPEYLAGHVMNLGNEEIHWSTCINEDSERSRRNTFSTS